MSALDTTPYWDTTSSMTRWPALDRNLAVDVVIIGAGLTGLTTAYLLKRSGSTVAVLDRQRAGGVDTGVTTAHVTCVNDLSLLEMARTFGREQARAVWDAGMAAIEQIDSIVSGEGIACEWQRVPGYRHVPRGGEAKEATRLEEEATLARELGFDATFMAAVPFIDAPGFEIANQAKFHPRKYLAALAGLIDGGGCHIFDHTEAGEVTDDPLRVEANGHTITCGKLVIATHTPLVGKAGLLGALALQTKLYLYTSYVVGGRLPEGSVPEALFWDTENPYHYLRVDRHRGFDYVIFGGKDHKTGQTGDPAACFATLEGTARSLMPALDVTHRWSGQVVETNDGLPFIGETAPHQFAATGYSGNGMTFGTLSGMMARDYVLGRGNPWQSLFDVGRTKLRGGTWDYLKENVDYPFYLLRDWIAGPEGTSLRGVKRGEGRILELDGQTVAAYRNDRGKVTLLSPTCTHMGCRVHWNSTDGDWECPCHGSRFNPTGEVLAGPAESPLAPIKQQD